MKVSKTRIGTFVIAAALAGCGTQGLVADAVKKTEMDADGYVPGLQQGIFRNAGRGDVNFSATCADADKFSHTLGTILADVNQTGWCQVRNALAGTIEKWEEHAAILYEGEMYFEGGVEYNFFGCVDNLVACQVDGEFLLCEEFDPPKEGVSVSSKTFKSSGWRPIRVWIADWGGPHGAHSGRIGFQGVGIGWNTNGCKIVNSSTELQWNRLLDDGRGRLLRSKAMPRKRGASALIGKSADEVRIFGAQDGLPFDVEMVWVEGRGDVDGFWVSKGRVTQRQWKSIMGYTPVDKDKQDDDASVERIGGGDIIEFLWGLNARYTGAGRFARIEDDARRKLAAKYIYNSIALPGESAGLQIAFFPTDRRGSEREQQKLVKRDSDVAFEAKLAKGDARRFSLAKGVDLDMIKVEGCGEPFYLGRYEVTKEQYEKVVVSTSPAWHGTDNLPINGVNWTNAMMFCEKLNELVPVEGMTWTLPSIKQWVFAANGGLKKQGNSFCGGNDWREVGWWSEGLHPVGLKKPNELGIHDLFGNVWEWCCDGDGRNDHRYAGGTGAGAYFTEFIWRPHVNATNWDLGFRVALVPKAK